MLGVRVRVMVRVMVMVRVRVKPHLRHSFPWAEKNLVQGPVRDAGRASIQPPRGCTVCRVVLAWLGLE